MGLRRRHPLEPVRGVQPLRGGARAARATSSARSTPPTRTPTRGPGSSAASITAGGVRRRVRRRVRGARPPRCRAPTCSRCSPATSAPRWSTLLDDAQAPRLPARLPDQQRRRPTRRQLRAVEHDRRDHGPLRRGRRSRARSACASPSRGSTRWPASCSASTPTECVFLDDLGINLKPAAAMGMTTIKVVDRRPGARRAATPSLGRPARTDGARRHEPANGSSMRSASSWSWMALEPVAGLPLSTRATWRRS